MGAAQGIGEEPLVVRVLLTGAGGQLGADIVAAAAQRDGIELHAFDRAHLDVTEQRGMLTIDEIGPDAIIHTAAYTAVDACEADPETARIVNDVGTQRVTAMAGDIGARVIYTSTDYVFDGTKAEPYIESDEPNPQSEYGKTKLAGERHVASLGDHGLIVRTSWVCGANGSNMVKTILQAADKHPTLTFVDDQIGKPTFTTDLADTLLTLAERNDPADSGIMHVTNEGAVSWFEFCQDVLEFAGLGRDRVQACATHELQPPRPAQRPANSVLANTRFGELGLPLLRHYREPLRETVHDLTS